MIERILHGQVELAIIVRHSFGKQGIEFVTDESYSQQLGYMCRPAGWVIPPHVHNPVERRVHMTQEVLYIKRGRVRVDFYADDRSYVRSAVLEPGDVILLAGGGHGFEMLEESEMIEVKQGPYAGDKDKTQIEPVAKDRVEIIGSAR